MNCRPERLDPPRRMLAMVDDMGVKVAIDTDAHARGQLAWHGYGCARVADTEIRPDRIVNAWAARRPARLDRVPRARRLTNRRAERHASASSASQFGSGADDDAFVGRPG